MATATGLDGIREMWPDLILGRQSHLDTPASLWSNAADALVVKATTGTGGKWNPNSAWNFLTKAHSSECKAHAEAAAGAVTSSETYDPNPSRESYARFVAENGPVSA